MSVIRPGSASPWGSVQHVTELRPGMIVVSTASHGGIHLDPNLNRLVPSSVRTSDGWYEEDCLALIAAYCTGYDRSEGTQKAIRHWFADDAAEILAVSDPTKSSQSPPKGGTIKPAFRPIPAGDRARAVDEALNSGPPAGDAAPGYRSEPFRCPCGGELRVIETGEKYFSVDPREGSIGPHPVLGWDSDEVEVSCRNCDEWGSDKFHPDAEELGQAILDRYAAYCERLRSGKERS